MKPDTSKLEDLEPWELRIKLKEAEDAWDRERCSNPGKFCRPCDNSTWQYMQHIRKLLGYI